MPQPRAPRQPARRAPNAATPLPPGRRLARRARQLLRLALRRDTRHVPREPELLEAADQRGGQVDLVPLQAVARGAREGVVVVVPRLAERRDGEPEHVRRLVLDLEAPAA